LLRGGKRKCDEIIHLKDAPQLAGGSFTQGYSSEGAWRGGEKITGQESKRWAINRELKR
jgi:hypothetical protein